MKRNNRSMTGDGEEDRATAKGRNRSVQRPASHTERPAASTSTLSYDGGDAADLIAEVMSDSQSITHSQDVPFIGNLQSEIDESLWGNIIDFDQTQGDNTQGWPVTLDPPSNPAPLQTGPAPFQAPWNVEPFTFGSEPAALLPFPSYPSLAYPILATTDAGATNPNFALGRDTFQTPVMQFAGDEDRAALDAIEAWLHSNRSSASPSMDLLAGTQAIIADAKADDGDAQDETVKEPKKMAAYALSDSVLIPTLMLFYGRLGGVMPVFSREWIFSRLDRDEHRTNAHFAAMLTAMSALTVIQIQKSPYSGLQDAKTGTVSSRKRHAKAVQLMNEALKLREGFLQLGNDSSLESCFTSFFIAISLFEMGEHESAWYRLRESITTAHLCKLHKPSAYDGLQKDEVERRLRAYWILAITERACALQCGMPISLTGNPRAHMASLKTKFGLKDFKDFPDMQLRLFDFVDETFVNCWNKECQGTQCKDFGPDRVVQLWQWFTESDAEGSASAIKGKEADSEGKGASGIIRLATVPHHRQVQLADVEVTRHWLMNRLWLITLNHGLLKENANEPPLRFDHVIYTAQSVADVCDGTTIAAMEALGIGVAYKLFDIAKVLVTSFEDISIAKSVQESDFDDKRLDDATVRRHMRQEKAKSGDKAQAQATKDAKGNDKTTGADTARASNPKPQSDDEKRKKLQRTILRILNQYRTLCQKLHNGDHPFTEKIDALISRM